MSFIRVGRPSAPGRRKKASLRKKPVWDDTLQDLTVHKATSEEQAYRKTSHVSKHGLKTKLEKQEKKHRKARSPKRMARQVAVMKEILYDQQQLHDVLSKSDQMMSVVQDLFGDDPRRFAGFPNVTTAPGQADPNKKSGLVASPPDIQTRLEALSQSIMDGTALNDDSEDEDDNDHSDEGPDPIVYQPRLNLDRFHQFLAAEEQNGTLSTISGAGQEVGGEPGPAHSTKLPDSMAISCSAADGSLFETPPRGHRSTTSHTPKSAANDTGKIKRSKQRVGTAAETSQSSSAFSLNDLRKVLTGLEAEIAEFEHQTGRQQLTNHSHGDSFSGYTLTLVGAVTKLTRYLKETELRLRAETTVREQLSQDVLQLSSLVDALTSDIIYTQEEYGKVLREFDQYKKGTQQELHEIKQALQVNRHRDMREPLYTEQVQHHEDRLTTPPKQTPQTQVDVGEDLSSPVPPIPVSLAHQMEPLQAAVLLSPPVQRNRAPPKDHSNLAGKQSSLLNVDDVLSPVVPSIMAVSSDGVTVLSGSLSQPTAVVTVPRPVSLVQTNVGVPLSHNLPPHSHPPGNLMPSQNRPVQTLQQQLDSQNPSRSENLEAVHFQKPFTIQNYDAHDVTERAGNPEKNSLASQIAELNRQHEEAQKRLQTLMLQQQQQPPRPAQTEGHQPLPQAHSSQQQQQQVNRSLPQAHTSQHHMNSGLIPPGQPSVQHAQAQRSRQQVQSSLPRPVFNQPHVTHKKQRPVGDPVSPDVSPISERSSSARVSLPANNLYSKGQVAQADYPGRALQGIAFSIPTMQLDLSQYSEPSPNQHVDLITQLAEACQ